MTVNAIVKLLNAKAFNLADGDKEVTCGYAGDFLSFVMGKAPTDCVWFTVMSNINVCAVATLAEVSVVTLCEGVIPDEQLLNKCRQQGVNIIGTEYDIYNAVKEVADKL